MHLQFFEINVLAVTLYKDLKKTLWSFFNFFFFFIAVKNLVLNLFWNCISHFFGGFAYFPEMLFTNILFFSFSKKIEKCVFFEAVS